MPLGLLRPTCQSHPITQAREWRMLQQVGMLLAVGGQGATAPQSNPHAAVYRSTARAHAMSHEGNSTQPMFSSRTPIHTPAQRTGAPLYAAWPAGDALPFLRGASGAVHAYEGAAAHGEHRETLRHAAWTGTATSQPGQAVGHCASRTCTTRVRSWLDIKPRYNVSQHRCNTRTASPS